ncbi:MAG: ATP-dependent 6-phosphofructokinase [Herpetosiphonaceae bacterium]|nr:MAG: ATP-dependent 6-phosphofructokinase [Herpetosiphonaceae bacterium]
MMTSSGPIRRVALLTSGGDAPGLNAVIRAFVKTARLEFGWDVYGVEDGFEGLIGKPKIRPLDLSDVRGLLPMGGTILGSTNKGHFSSFEIVEGRRVHDPAALNAVCETVRKLRIDGLVVLGGEGSQAIALDLYENGVPTVGVPKTIDNDLGGTDMTFGFHTALWVATDAIDRLHSTAASHDRVMVLEVMGRHAGWIALYAGIGGGADVILIPEIPFTFEAVADKILEREAHGTEFSIIVVAEGATPAGGTAVYQSEHEKRLGGIGQSVAEEVQRRTGKETRVVVLGHLQRGGSPTPSDRVLATRFGVAAAKAIAERKFGQMVALRCGQLTTVPLREVAGIVRGVPVDSDLISTARALGISMGDERG